MAKYFIDHPVFACVLSIIIALIGIISAYNLPIAQYPQISNPVSYTHLTLPTICSV